MRADDYQVEVSKLRERVAYLEAEVDYYKHVPPAPMVDLRGLFNITPAAAKILRALADGHLCSDAYLHEIACGPTSSFQNIKVHVCKLRKAIAPIRIVRERHDGYFIAAEDISGIRAIISGKKPPAAKKLLGVSE